MGGHLWGQQWQFRAARIESCGGKATVPIPASGTLMASWGVWDIEDDGLGPAKGVKSKLRVTAIVQLRSLGAVHLGCTASGKPLIYFSTFFSAFPCFSVKKQKNQKKAIPSTFFVLVKLLRKSTRKADYQMDKNGQKKCPKMDKIGPNRPKWTKMGPNIQCSPRKMSKKAQKAQEKYRGLLVTSSQYFSKRVLFLLRKAGKSMKSMEK